MRMSREKKENNRAHLLIHSFLNVFSNQGYAKPQLGAQRPSRFATGVAETLLLGPPPAVSQGVL